MIRLSTFLFLLLLAFPIAAGEGPAELAPYRDVLAVFDALEMPDVRGARLVLFNTGGYWITGGGTAFEFVYTFGWLLEESQSEVRILENTGFVSRHDRKSELPEEWEKHRDGHPKDLPLPGAFRVMDWAKFSDEVVVAGIRDYFGALGHLVRGGLEHPVEAALYGYWAFRRGETDRARKLFEVAGKSAESYGRHRSSEQRTLAMLVRDSIATNVRWRAIEAANGGAARTDLLERWRLLLRLAGNDESSEASRMVGHYESLVAEDEAFAEPTPEEFEKLSDAAKADYWFHHLRDVAEVQVFQPGSVSILGLIWPDSPKAERSAAWRLVDLGWAAVPLLIEHLDDARPTRSMGYWRNYAKGSHHLLTLGHGCREILQQIAGRRLPPDDAAAAKKRARKWLAEYRKKGELAMLREAVAAGGLESPAQAAILAEKFPEAALKAIRAGALRTTSDRVRSGLVRAAGRIEGDGPVRWLLAEMRSAPHLATRLAAARILFDRDRAEALTAMIGEWGRVEAGAFDTFRPERDLIDFLVRSASPEAIRALGRDLDRLGVRGRFQVVTGVYNVFAFPAQRERAGEAVMGAAEDLFVTRLGDTERYRCSYGSFTVSLKDPRICDLAGMALNDLFGDRYEYQADGPLQIRERQRIEVRNRWRETRGLPPLAVPEPPKIEPLDPTVAKRLLDAIATAGDEDARSVAVRALREQGLSALRPVLERLTATPESHAAHPALATLARELACVVRECSFAPDSFEIRGELRDRLRALVGVPLTAESFLGVLHSFVTERPEGAGGIRLTADRAGNGTGILLRITIEERTWDAPEPRHCMGRPLPDVMVHSEYLKVSGRTVRSVSGSGESTYAPGSRRHRGLEGTVRRALRRPPGVPIEIGVHLVEKAGAD